MHLGTGNYNILTARTYEDYGLFTADPEIGADVADLFNFLTGFAHPQPFRKLLVAPFGLREGLIGSIRDVRRAAANGEEARIRIKVNSLNDEEIINELYRASQEGAKIDIVARSICTLRPGVPGLSETIRVRSVLGRFLEHSRLFIFDAGDESTFYLGSADLMPRNLDHRIELVAPVEDARAQNDMRARVRRPACGQCDSVGAELGRPVDEAPPRKGDRGRAAQAVFMRSAKARARRRAANVRAR